MTRIGLLSDTHAYWDEKYLEYFEPCDEIWHAGVYPFILRQKRNVALKEKPFALLGYTERANLVFIARNVAYNV